MKTKTKLLRFLGGFLLFASGVITFLWFYWLAPFRHVRSVAWWSDHSTKCYLKEVQRQIRRTGLDHDGGIALGLSGDKKWVEWTMARIRPRQDISGCGNYHLDSALADMTNQRFGTNAQAWLAWWTTNRNKTQLEWIREGFAQEGIQLQQPLTTNNIVALLKLAAPSAKPATTNVIARSRDGLRFNAQRWLRDAGFRPREFDLACLSVEERDLVVSGLVSYALWLGEHKEDPGKLPIRGEESNDIWSGVPLSPIEQPLFKWTLNLILISMAVCGMFLLRRKAAP